MVTITSAAKMAIAKCVYITIIVNVISVEIIVDGHRRLVIITYQEITECLLGSGSGDWRSGSGDGQKRTKRSENLLNEHEITFRNPWNGKSFQYYSNELFFTLIDLKHRITNANNTVTE